MKLEVFTKLVVAAAVISVSALATSMDEKIDVISQVSIHDKASTSSFGSNRSRNNGNSLEKREKCSAWVEKAADKAGATVCDQSQVATKASK